MKLIIEETGSDVADFAAKYVRKRINEFGAGPDKYFVLGLPTGIIQFLFEEVSFFQAQPLSECTRN